MTFSGTADTARADNHERDRLPDSVSQFLADLPPGIAYAIERGLPDMDTALKSDLDLVIGKWDFSILFDQAAQRRMVVSIAVSFGGARLFIACRNGIKRIDCMWHCSYFGIPLCSTQALVRARRSDPDTRLHVLPEAMQAEVAFAVKNAHGGAEKYRELLERHGLRVLSAGARRRWLLSKAIRNPLAALTGMLRVTLSYAFRLTVPAGVMVYGASATDLASSDTLRYLFQGRIRSTSPWSGFIRSRLAAELCVVATKNVADIDLSDMESLQSAECAVLAYLRKHRSRVPSLVMAVC